MRQDLDTLRKEIEQLLASYDFAVFRGQFRAPEGLGEVYWDVEEHAEPKEFLDAATKLDIKLICFHSRVFTEEMISEALEKLEAVQMPRDEYRETERAVRKLEAYEGFTCGLQLSFDYQNNTYLFEANAGWYDEFLSILDSLDDALDHEGEEQDPGPLGGFYSNN